LYFPLRARNQSILMIAEHVGFEMEQAVVSMVQWGNVKPLCPNKQVPVLLVPNKPAMPESIDIAKYVAENGKKQIDVDKTMDLYEQSQQEGGLIMAMPLLNYFPKEESLKKAGEWAKQAKESYTKLDERLNQTAGAFFGGAKPGIGDFGIFHCYTCAVNVIKPLGIEDFTAGLSDKWKQWVVNMCNDDAVKKVLKSRPKAQSGKVGMEKAVIWVDEIVECPDELPEGWREKVSWKYD